MFERGAVRAGRDGIVDGRAPPESSFLYTTHTSLKSFALANKILSTIATILPVNSKTQCSRDMLNIKMAGKSANASCSRAMWPNPSQNTKQA